MATGFATLFGSSNVNVISEKPGRVLVSGVYGAPSTAIGSTANPSSLDFYTATGTGVIIVQISFGLKVTASYVNTFINTTAPGAAYEQTAIPTQNMILNQMEAIEDNVGHLNVYVAEYTGNVPTGRNWIVMSTQCLRPNLEAGPAEETKVGVTQMFIIDVPSDAVNYKLKYGYDGFPTSELFGTNVAELSPDACNYSVYKLS